ncbi:hypothetical protein SD70_11870 [Gordoniibacillus kamchatkensis]|uniref:HTH araC/xylS-type domain-containing protein n=1 Tax=Gordoniibacillus kamchatkensis TaxID=1590651 RepID=A0ABR5AI74_9BACL|nr:helix-turn-helix transcriptional regulator [Paenibacillus sp. VKM B-2647]KIL40755.1 hypothetical protein SD70_11870 [Paenibacillus sp. VKM B-2647]
MTDPERWLAAARQFGIDLAKHAYLPVYGYANQYRRMKQRFLSDELFMYTLENAISEIIDASGLGVSLRFGMNEIFLLLPLRSNSRRPARDDIAERLRAAQADINKYVKITVSFMVSEPSSSPQDLKKHLKEMAESKDLRFYAKEGSLYRWQPFQAADEDIYKYYSEVSDELKHHLAEGASDKVDGALAKWKERFESRRYKAEEIRGFTIKLLSDIDLKYRSQQHFPNAYSAEMLHQTLLELESLDELFAYVRAFLAEKMEYVIRTALESQRCEIVEAKKYVRTHMAHKIGLDEVARKLHLNASHFSRIFKVETGETFIEFVTRVKMEQAQQYLLQTEKSIDQIAAMLGYDNTSYFIKVFKSFAGMSPVHYRKLK